MRKLLLSALAVLPLSSVASAQEISLSYGVSLVSRYVSDGIEQSTGSAVQPWAELGYGGFYVGLWASNVSRAGLGAGAEVDLTFGYRGEAGMLSYDVGYARYYYTAPYSNCCGQFILALSSAPTEQSEFGFRVAYDPGADQVNARITVDYAPTDAIGLSLAAGSVSNGGQDYWSAGASYGVNENVSFGLTYSDSDVSKGIAVASIDLSF